MVCDQSTMSSSILPRCPTINALPGKVNASQICGHSLDEVPVSGAHVD